MKKRSKLFAALLAVCMMITMLPTVAFAEGEDTLQAKINAAKSGDTITLDKDYTESITIPAGKNITLDLANYTLTNQSSHTITNNGTLTITGTGTVDNVTHGKVALFNNGTATLNGGTFDRTAEKGTDSKTNGGNSGYTICNHGTITINNGAVVRTAGENKDNTYGKYSSLIENGYQDYNSGKESNGYVNGTNAANPTLIINGGTFIGGLNTVKNDDGGQLKINGGTYTNTAQAAVLNWNVAEITGGDFTVETNFAVILNGRADNNQTTDGTGLNQGKLTISGGTFKAPEGIDSIRKMENSTNMSDVKVSGGSFSSDVDEYVVTGSTAIKDVDGNYKIVEGTRDPSVTDGVAVAKIGNKYYGTLDAAITAATDGQTIQLVSDITVSDDNKGNTNGIVTITSKTITIDGDGHKIIAAQTTDTSKLASVFNIESGANVTFKDLIIDADAKAKHGLNIYGATVQVKDCTIKNGSGYGIVCNSSNLTVDGITTSDNVWGGINVDNRIANTGSTFTMKAGTINEKDSVYFENTNNEKIAATINGGTFNGKVSVKKDVSNVTLTVNAGTYSNSVAQYATKNFEVNNAGKYTYYDTAEEAITAAGSTGVITAIADASGNKLTITAPTSGSITVTADTVVKAPSGYYLTSVKNADGTITYTAHRSGGVVVTPPVDNTCPKDSTCPISKFTDAVPTAWYHDGVHYVLDAGLMQGQGNNKFAPNSTLTRAELAQILYNKAGNPTVSGLSTFTDVPATAWYAKAVAWAQQNNVVSGIGGNKFAPQQAITREAIAAMLYRNAGSPAVTGILDFKDAAGVSDWAKDSVLWATQNKVINGAQQADGTLLLNAKTGATRAETATMLEGYYNK